MAGVSSRLAPWGRVTHICVNKLTTIGSDNGLSPGRRQAIIRTNAGILLIRPLGTNFSDFLVEILIFSFKKMRLKMSSAKRRPFCLGLNELTSKCGGLCVWRDKNAKGYPGPSDNHNYHHDPAFICKKSLRCKPQNVRQHFKWSFICFVRTFPNNFMTSNARYGDIFLDIKYSIIT